MVLAWDSLLFAWSPQPHWKASRFGWSRFHLCLGPEFHSCCLVPFDYLIGQQANIIIGGRGSTTVWASLRWFWLGFPRFLRSHKRHIEQLTDGKFAWPSIHLASGCRFHSSRSGLESFVGQLQIEYCWGRGSTGVWAWSSIPCVCLWKLFWKVSRYNMLGLKVLLRLGLRLHSSCLDLET